MDIIKWDNGNFYVWNFQFFPRSNCPWDQVWSFSCSNLIEFWDTCIILVQLIGHTIPGVATSEFGEVLAF